MILALDLSTPRGDLAVVEAGGGAIFSESFKAHRSHNALVFEPLGRALEACGDEGPELVVIGTGPGSYTGVRVAIAAGIGVAMSFGVPVVGWPSADAAAYNLNVGGSSEAGFLFVGDARRGKYFGVERKPGGRGSSFDPVVLGAEAMGDWLDAQSGVEVITFDPEVPEPARERARKTYPEARRLGSLISELDEAEVDLLAGRPVEPIYLAAPFVTKPKGR